MSMRDVLINLGVRHEEVDGVEWFHFGDASSVIGLKYPRKHFKAVPKLYCSHHRFGGRGQAQQVVTIEGVEWMLSNLKQCKLPSEPQVASAESCAESCTNFTAILGQGSTKRAIDRLIGWQTQMAMKGVFSNSTVKALYAMALLMIRDEASNQAEFDDLYKTLTSRKFNVEWCESIIGKE